ncbi:MAG TPA: hypothetical protein VIP82_04610 [Microbacterium sp.]|uniref:hypothetical protein n=1 Tax=Microbacterium sp. TaxID=51671 RepID=UPI002F939A7C
MPGRRRVATAAGAVGGGAASVVLAPATAAFAVDRTCDAAVALAKGGGDDALRVAAELLENQGWSAAQIATCLAPAKSPSPEYTEISLGDLWKAFTENVEVLLPIAAFVGVFALVLLALGRLLALVPGLRNPRSSRGWRIFAWIVGLSLAVIAPALIALRGMWVMAQGGPAGRRDVDAAEFTYGQFLHAVLWRSGAWWLLLLLLVLTVATLTFAFATRQGVTIKLEGKDDGKSLDTAHVMAAMDGMAGRTNRGLEFPVGTDLTTAASAVTELSDNKFVATLQVGVSAILGSTPWRVTVENETEKAASVTISRNGALMKAKRIKVGDDLAGVNELTSAEMLAARIAGELIATLRSKYRSEFDANLSGATDGESIALHYIASNALTASREARSRGIPLLARAVEVDPHNRAAWTTLANFAYRDPTIHRPDNHRPHVEYREFLDRAILDELARCRNRWDVVYEGISEGRAIRRHGDDDLSKLELARRRVRISRMRNNGLLIRLLQTRVVAGVNAKAAGADIADGTAQDLSDREYMRLRRDTFGGPLSWREPPKTAIRRRQLLLLDEFRYQPTHPVTLEPPEVLQHPAFRGELRAWRAVARRSGSGASVEDVLVECEDAALSASGDYSHDPGVAYSVACYRAQLWKDRMQGRTP